jgi:hypothetical protein
MKPNSFSISILAAAIIIMGVLAAPLQASQYLGEVTWDYSGDGTFKVGISKVGGSYYEVQGQAVTPNGTIIFSGGGGSRGEWHFDDQRGVDHGGNQQWRHLS